MDYLFCFFKQKTAYELRISDWSSDVCSSDLLVHRAIAIGVGALDEDVDLFRALQRGIAAPFGPHLHHPGDLGLVELAVAIGVHPLEHPSAALRRLRGGERRQHQAERGDNQNGSLPVLSSPLANSPGTPART